MKRSIILGAVALSLIIASCGDSANKTNTESTPTEIQPATPENTEMKDENTNKEIEVSGKIIKIENGKDGYMATLDIGDGKTYVATISVVNLQKSNSEYKAHKEGETITVKGPSWTDDAGIIYIKAESLK
ncbi:hypothetical protein [Polluticaenibacter yanchengensis]|uniref:Uncharacterized protein n=1 Tax=Polluticaenibacter yanchengensis TaxID=3014562 RepID=A0ABT4UIF5_9BACT|nr:hypothetical protein [Chitinophagaceae bacterium LY-5]